MKEVDFIESIAFNDEDMELLKSSYKYMYDKIERKEMFKIARKISRFNKFNIVDSKKEINENELTNNFLHSLEIFNSDKIYNYFKNKSNKLTIFKDKGVKDDASWLEYEIIDGKETNYCVKLPSTHLTYSNQLGFAHELGHIPEIDKPRASFFEYQEVLPMFLEYIEGLHMYGESKIENFIYERLNMEIDASRSILKTFKRCDHKNYFCSTYYKQDFAYSYKYLESLDYTLQLIDTFEKDKDLIKEEIEKVINGKSLIDVSNDLEIDTFGCQRLLMEYKRR